MTGKRNAGFGNVFSKTILWENPGWQRQGQIFHLLINFFGLMTVLNRWFRVGFQFQFTFKVQKPFSGEVCVIFILWTIYFCLTKYFDNTLRSGNKFLPILKLRMPHQPSLPISQSLRESKMCRSMWRDRLHILLERKLVQDKKPRTDLYK